MNTDNPADESNRKDVDPGILLFAGDSTEIEHESHNHDCNFDLLSEGEHINLPNK